MPTSIAEKNARADHNAAMRRYNRIERKARQEQIQQLVACHRKWKAQRSAPFEYLRRTFDVIPGSLELCDALFEGLYACLTGLQDGVAAKLDELDQLEARYAAIARLDQCFYGTLVANERDGVNRAQHAQDGWRHDGDGPFEFHGLTFTRVLEPLAINDARAVSGRDRTAALHQVLRAQLLSGEPVESVESVYAAADALAAELALRNPAL